MKMTVNTPPHPTSTKTPGASDEHLLTTTKHNMISNNNKKHNNIRGCVTKKNEKIWDNVPNRVHPPPIGH